jgi:hypothetical protein
MASSLAFVVLFRSLRASGGLRTGSTGAVGPVGRLRCDARVGVAPPNSLRSPAVRCARTTASSQFTKRASRADPDAALLAAPHSPAHRPPLARGNCLAGLVRSGSPSDGPAILRADASPRGLPLCVPPCRRVGWGQVVAPVGLAEERRAVGPRAQRASSSDWPRLIERSEPQVSVASSAAGPAARAPQGSRPSGPTETVGRHRRPPSDVRQRMRRARWSVTRIPGAEQTEHLPLE